MKPPTKASPAPLVSTSRWLGIFSTGKVRTTPWTATMVSDEPWVMTTTRGLVPASHRNEMDGMNSISSSSNLDDIAHHSIELLYLKPSVGLRSSTRSWVCQYHIPWPPHRQRPRTRSRTGSRSTASSSPSGLRRTGSRMERRDSCRRLCCSLPRASPR